MHNDPTGPLSFVPGFIFVFRLVGLLAIPHDGLHVLHGPGEQLFENRAQGSGTRRKRILDPGRDLRMECPRDVAILFKRTQGRRQHLLRDVGHGLLQLREAQHPRL